MKAVCSADSSHVIKVDKWIDGEPYHYYGWIFGLNGPGPWIMLSHCPICGAAIVVEEEK